MRALLAIALAVLIGLALFAVTCAAVYVLVWVVMAVLELFDNGVDWDDSDDSE